jgi:hypothetical protein
METIRFVLPGPKPYPGMHAAVQRCSGKDLRAPLRVNAEHEARVGLVVVD